MKQKKKQLFLFDFLCYIRTRKECSDITTYLQCKSRRTMIPDILCTPNEKKKQHLCVVFLMLCDSTRVNTDLVSRKTKEKTRTFVLVFGAPSATRTRDTLIKSQVLYRLS